MDYQERIGMLEEAGEMLLEVVDTVRQAVAGTREESRARAYIVPHLMSWVDDPNQQVTIASMIASFEEEIGGYDDDEDVDDDEW